ncbi:MAG: hypothetical protein V1847_04045 [Candidatus Diapherotrites archaeon]
MQADFSKLRWKDFGKLSEAEKEKLVEVWAESQEDMALQTGERFERSIFARNVRKKLSEPPKAKIRAILHEGNLIGFVEWRNLNSKNEIQILQMGITKQFQRQNIFRGWIVPQFAKLAGFSGKSIRVSNLFPKSHNAFQKLVEPDTSAGIGRKKALNESYFFIETKKGIPHKDGIIRPKRNL